MITIESYNESHRHAWENLVDGSYNGTFMHKRTFIDYHKDRFEDASLVIYNNEKICGVFPAVKYEDKVVSHPGLAIGGLVYNDRVRGYDLLDILIKIKEYYNYLPIIYKTTPSEFQRHSVSDDTWALYNLKAKKISCELSSVLNPLTTNYEYWPDKKTELSHLKNNIVLSAMNLSDLDLVKEFWEKAELEAKKINPNCKFEYISMVKYSNEFGEPTLRPHFDHPTKVCFILDYQLDGNVKWPIVVNLEEFTLENNECLVFDNNMAIHWRPPQKFKEDESLTMLFYSFKDENKVIPTLEGQAEEIDKYFKQYIDEYNKVFEDSGTQSKVSFQTSRLADLFRWAQERDKPKNNEL
jgi:hypothetical protein